MEKKSKGYDDESSGYDRFRKKLKNTIFKNYYSLLKRQFKMSIFYFLIQFFEAVQILFLITVNKKYKDYISASSKLDLSFDSAINYTSLITTFYPFGDFKSASIFLYIISSVILMKIVIFIFLVAVPLYKAVITILIALKAA